MAQTAAQQAMNKLVPMPVLRPVQHARTTAMTPASAARTSASAARTPVTPTTTSCKRSRFDSGSSLTQFHGSHKN